MLAARDRSFFRRELIAADLGGLAGVGTLNIKAIQREIANWHFAGKEWKEASLHSRETGRGPPLVDNSVVTDAASLEPGPYGPSSPYSDLLGGPFQALPSQDRLTLEHLDSLSREEILCDPEQFFSMD